MAEFKRANFVGSYIMEHQIETEEELAAVWLSQLEAQLFLVKWCTTPQIIAIDPKLN